MSLPLSSDIPIYYKLQNTKYTDKLQSAQKIPVFPLMCEWHLKVKYPEQHTVILIAGEDKRLHKHTNKFLYVKRRKLKREIILAIKDHNGTIITNTTEKPNI
jgi:hypothetical protein